MASHKFETAALHAGAFLDAFGSRALPVHRTAAYQFRDTEHAANLFGLKELGNIYSRLTNPTTDVLEQRMAALEGGKAAVAVASGTTAIHYTVLNICKQGDEVVSSAALYGGTYTMFAAILPDQGITTRFADFTNPDDIRANITDKTKMLFTEVVGNPSLDVVNLTVVAAVAKEYNLPLVVDSTFTPPSILRPIEHGANVVIHSLTKWICGHGTGIGGIVVDGGNFDWTDEKFALYNEPDPSYHNMRYAHDLGDFNPLAFAFRFRLVPLRNLGGCLGADNAWLFLQGLETLALRMERHCENALKVATYLQEHPHVAWVRHPSLPEDPSYAVASKLLPSGSGGMVVFGIKPSLRAECVEGDAACDTGARFINSLKLVSHLANIGDAKTLAIHPASTTHSQLSAEQQQAGGITPDMIRLSVGIEHVDDIIADLEQAITAAVAR